MGREVKSRRCRSSSPPSLSLSIPTNADPPHPSPLSFFLSPFFLSHSHSPLPSLKHESGRTVWSCHSLKSPDGSLARCCSAGCHRDICIRRGRSAGQRVQVSSLSGSCPYLPQVAPSDRPKVRADLVYIDDSVSFSFLFLSAQWPVSDKDACLWTMQSDKLAEWFVALIWFHCWNNGLASII